MKALCVLVVSLSFFFGCVGLPTNTTNPPISEKQIIQLHQTLISMQQASSPDVKGSFLITWGPNPLSDNIDKYNIYRSTGLNSQFVLIFTASATDNQYRDTTVLKGIRYKYALTTFRDSLESEFSNILSGAWVSVGSPTTSKEATRFHDSLWTTNDLLIVFHPAYHPCTIDWIRSAGGESVRWIGLFDVDHNQVVDIRDLVYYGANYGKVAWDSLGISR